jgi:phosphosulfolactate synthase
MLTTKPCEWRDISQSMKTADKTSTTEYLDRLGVSRLPAKTIPFDPGYDPATVRAHLEQSAHLMSGFKLSMACWQIANEAATRQKIAAIKENGLFVMAGGGPFEIACTHNLLTEYLELCQMIGFDCIEAGEGFATLNLDCNEVVLRAYDRGLSVYYELGQKHEGPISSQQLDGLIRVGEQWLEAGVPKLIIEARESAQDVGLFDKDGQLNASHAEQFVKHFGLEQLVFEAPNKQSQFAFLSHFGNQVELCNVRPEELLRIEIFRRGLHPDSFTVEKLRPKPKI